MRPRVVTLKAEAQYHGVQAMNAAEKKEAKEVLETFAKLEREKKRLEKAKNSLESYIINTRSALNNEPDVQQVL
jgi:hypothetical protein